MKTKPQKIRYGREQVFADLLTSQDKEFYYQPAVFHVNGIQYRPDFYTPEDGVFYEVAGTRQAFNQNRQKIDLVRNAYPFLKIEIVNPDGTPYRFCGIRKSMNPPPRPFPKRFCHYWDLGRYRGLDVERRRQFISREKLALMTRISPDAQQWVNHSRQVSEKTIQVFAQALKRSPEYIRFLIEKHPNIQEIEEWETKHKIPQNQQTLFEPEAVAVL